MPESLEEMLTTAKAAIEPDYRQKLLARGGARGLVWKDGQLPSQGAPQFAKHLSDDLGHYGFGMLSLGLRLREAGDRSETTLRTFECASRAIESIVVNGPPESADRLFYTMVSACAAHLGRFSARAASILNRVQEPHDGNDRLDAITVVRHLILRRLDAVRDICWQRSTSVAGWDQRTTEAIKDGKLSRDGAAVEFLLLLYFRGVAQFGTALFTGESLCVREAIQQLKDAERIAAELNHPIYWWCCRLVRHLFDDLWPLTLHELLPVAPDGTSPQWQDLREKFITLLAARSAAEVELWPSQVEPAAKVCGQSAHLVAALPTSAGKTRIAEIAILWALSLGQKVVFVTPLRALSAQTERSLAKRFEPLGAKVTSAYSGSGVSASEAARISESNVIVCTPEKLDFGLRNNPNMLDSVGCVVLDEGHMLGADERRIRYEVLIQRLVRRSDAASRRIICLSAMLPEGEATEDFSAWLACGATIHLETNAWRPTRRIIGQVDWNSDVGMGKYTADCQGSATWINGFVTRQTKVGPRGGQTHFPDTNSDFTLACASRLADEGRSVMIYCAQRNEVESIAKAFVKAVKAGWIKALPTKEPLLIDARINELAEWLEANHPVFAALRNGLAVHHARLPRSVLGLIERLLAERLVTAVVASPTLAQGLNLSASCLLFHSTQRRPSGQALDITADEIANVAGRAGRAFVDVEGLVLGMGFSQAQRGSWQRLRQHASTGQATLESGLLLVAQQLLLRVVPQLGGQALRNWVAESSPLTQFVDEGDDAAQEANAWDLLDTALLALAGDADSDISVLADTLDDVLRDSYLRKRLARLNQSHSQHINDLLVGRAQRIWKNTSSGQRLACYQAGIGVRSGLALTVIQASAADILAEVHEAIAQRDRPRFVKEFVHLAEALWVVKPFVPQKAFHQGSAILAGWLNGEAASALAKLDEDAMSFIEDAVIYRLTWGVEAVRLMAVAGGDTRFSDEPSPCLARLEHGLFDDVALWFKQLGIESRITCEALPSCFSPAPHDLNSARNWLESENAQEAMRNPNFPTTLTHPLFVNFMHGRGQEANKRARFIAFTLQLVKSIEPLKGTVVARSMGGNHWSLYSPDLLEIGRGTSSETHIEGSVAHGFVRDGKTVSLHFWINV